MGTTSISSITKKILEIEKNNDLLNWVINDVFVWQSARVVIYSNIQELVNSQIPQSSPAKKTGLLNVIYNRFIVNAIFYNPFLDLKKNDALVFESSRKYNVDGEYIDIYTKYLCDELAKKNVSFKKYQSSYSFDKLSSNRSDTKHLDHILLLAKLRAKFIKVKYSAKDLERIETIKTLLRNTFKIEIDLMAIIDTEIKKMRSQYHFFNRLYRRKKVKEIYLVNFCDKAPLILAAKNNNVKVVEMQHGLMVKEDLIFHFPDSEKGKVNYFPTDFYVWDTDLNSSVLPIEQKNILVYGNKFLENRVSKFSNTSKIKNRLLIISQPSLTNEMVRFTLNNTATFKDLEVIYKLHPIEEQGFKTNPHYSQLSQISNLKIVGNNVSMYELLAGAQNVIGVYSTAMYEALAFKCNVFLLDLPGVEMMQPLVDNGRVRMFAPSLFENKMPAA
ncbi:MAG: hypothetical protein ABIP51_22020 [Bacteroidia bacterium]